MVEQKATQVCLLAQDAYPEDRRATLVSSPPIGYILRLERETDRTSFRCIYGISDGRKIHDGACRFEGSDESVQAVAEPAANDPAGVGDPDPEAGTS